MYGLCDCNNFYASAEKVFYPAIRNSPIVVLSNNDGTIVALSAEAKKLGIKKFTPYFKIRKFLEQNNVYIFSSNYALYADLSNKMMSVISRFSDHTHIYSIDETFLKFTGFKSLITDWNQYGHDIRRAVWREVKLPTCVGFANTLTLVKAANHAAKKINGFNGVAVIEDKYSASDILKQIEITSVWGIGSRLGKKLSDLNITTAFELSNQSPKKMRKYFSVMVERTVEELNGNACFEWDEVKQPKQEIFSTGSFGNPISDRNELKSALVSHSVKVAKKLRNQGSLTKRLYIFACSSPFKSNYASLRYLYDFDSPTSDTTIIANAISSILPILFKSNILYTKCGVGAMDLVNEANLQSDLFTPFRDNKLLMKNLDEINSRFGTGTLRIASEKQANTWQMKQDFLSPQYTTKWTDVPIISC